MGGGGDAGAAASPSPTPSRKGRGGSILHHLAPRFAHRFTQRLACHGGGTQPITDRRQIARPTSPNRQPPKRAGNVGGSPERGAQFSSGVSLDEQPAPRILPCRDRCRVGQRCGKPRGQQPSARGRQRPLHRAEQRVQRPAVARAVDFQAGARRGIHGQQPGATLWHRAGKARQRACLGGADVVDRQQRRDGLGIGKAAESVETGNVECLGKTPPRHQRRGRRGLGRTLVVPVAGNQSGRRQNLRRLQPAKQAGQICTPERGGFEQASRHVEPGGADVVAALLRQTQQQVGLAGFQQRFLGDRAGGDQAHHLPTDGRLANAGLRILHLLGHGDAEPAADQAREIRLSRVLRHTAHRHRGSIVLAAVGQRDVERGGSRFRVGEEQLVEVAHAEEHERVRMRLLGGEPLRHRRRGAGGVQGAGGRGHRRGLACGGTIPKADGWPCRGRRTKWRPCSARMSSPG